MTDLTEMTFDSAEPIVIPITIGKDKYSLTEASESAYALYKDAQLKGMRIIEDVNGSKTSAISSVHNADTILVSYCLFKITDNGTQVPVSLETIKKWSHRIVKPLFDKIEEISAMKKIETVESLDKKIKELQEQKRKLIEVGTSEQETAIKN